jgi:hypothetical protein
MRVSGVVVLLEYPVRLPELAVQVHVNPVLSWLEVRIRFVEVLSQMDLTRGVLDRTGSGMTTTQ